MIIEPLLLTNSEEPRVPVSNLSEQSTNISSTVTILPKQAFRSAAIEPESTNISVGQRLTKPGIPMSESQYLDVEVINVDTFEFDDTWALRPKTSANLCEGYALALPDGQSPHDFYPFALHSLLKLPWNYSVHNDQIALFA